MSFWSDLTGSSQSRDIRNAGAAQISGYNQGIQSVQDHSGSAKNYLTPYQRGGDASYRQYTDALGVNGQGAQRSYWDTYQADPQRGYDENRAVDAVNRSMSARGMSRSGMGALAGARAGMDAGRSYTMDRLNRLQALGGQGYGAANQLANIDLGTGNTLANLYTGRGNAEAGMNMGLANARNIGVNNAFKIGGMLISAATGMPVDMDSGDDSSGGEIAPGGHSNWLTQSGPNALWT